MIKGQISVQTENIFPIIKKFLYTDQDIFLRELVSNAVDATTKLQTLAKRGEVQGEIGDTNIEVLIDEKAKTLTIRDKGIGLTADEAQRYLAEVAFSSAAEFIEKYQDGTIIGHFGLGFYSAFMVADRVEVISKSYKTDAEAVKWSCDGTPNYTLEVVEKATRGTDIVLYISEEAKEYLEEYRIEDLLRKHCGYLPIPIQFGESEKTEGKKKVKVPRIVNNTQPIWRKSPSELTDEDYQGFYGEMHPFAIQPLFWIHLNIDYPFNLTGILYFPKSRNAVEVQKNKIQLYANQVYVTDNIKEIVPDFLTLLHGVIDSPDIPLNVSRSALQADREVKKITTYITKKVADKLSELFNKDRAEFTDKWSDMSVFVKYGYMSDDKFEERAGEFLLYKNIDNQYFTLGEYTERVQALQTDKNGKLVFIYSNDVQRHDAQIAAAKAKGYDVLVTDNMIDNHFMQQVEYRNNNIRFVRVDSEAIDKIVEKDSNIASVLSEAQQQQVETVFKSLITPEQYHTKVSLRALAPTDMPVQITRSEFSRRMNEMRQFNAVDMGGIPEDKTVVVNTNNPIIAEKLVSISDEAAQKDLASYLYELACVSQGMLIGSDLTAFVNRSLNFLK